MDIQPPTALGRALTAVAAAVELADSRAAALAAFEAQDGGNHDGWAMYRNAFWVIRRDKVFTGSGIYGQYCFVHRPSRTVIARFSSYPEALPLDRFRSVLHDVGQGLSQHPLVTVNHHRMRRRID